MDNVANRYAVALLELARENGKILNYINETKQIIKILENQPDFLELLRSYGVSKDEKKQIIKACFEGKVNDYLTNLFYVLIDNKRGGILLNVCHEFVRIGYNELNIKQGVVYTTIKLSDTEMLKMQKKVSQILNCQVTLFNQIDPSIVGGYKIQVDDYIIDDTIQSRLNKLKESINLKKGEDA